MSISEWTTERQLLPTKNGGDMVSGSSRDSPGTMGIRPKEGNFPDSKILGI